MRDIKFRAWDKISRMYFYNRFLEDGTEWVITPDEGVIFSDNESYKKQDLIIEQYTGLKDKNGKEIYEGDILNFKDFNKCYQSYNGENRQTVVFSNGSFRFFDNGMPLTQDKIIRSNYEIIGNIHDQT